MNVWMITFGYHFDLWRLDWIILRNMEVKFEPTSAEWSVRWALDKSNPLVKVVIYRLKENVLVCRS